jgi:hypothetical protein
MMLDRLAGWTPGVIDITLSPRRRASGYQPLFLHKIMRIQNEVMLPSDDKSTRE